MQKPLKILIKISKNELDKKRRELAELLTKKENKILEIKNLNNALDDEMNNLNKNAEASVMFASFLALTRTKQAKIIEDIENLIDPQIRRFSEEISATFNEMKKYEILLEQKLTEAQNELNKKTQNILDEVALNQFTANNPTD